MLNTKPLPILDTESGKDIKKSAPENVRNLEMHSRKPDSCVHWPQGHHLRAPRVFISALFSLTNVTYKDFKSHTVLQICPEV